MNTSLTKSRCDSVTHLICKERCRHVRIQETHVHVSLNMSEFVSACIKKNPGAAYNLQFYDMFGNRTTHVCSVYVQVYESYFRSDGTLCCCNQSTAWELRDCFLLPQWKTVNLLGS